MPIWINFDIATTIGHTCASIAWVAPRYDWPIGFKDSKGTLSWINLGIRYGNTGAPDGSGYTKVYSTYGAFAALKADGSITAWGDLDYGGSGAPSGSAAE
jgi:hypothetical protein